MKVDIIVHNNVARKDYTCGGGLLKRGFCIVRAARRAQFPESIMHFSSKSRTKPKRNTRLDLTRSNKIAIQGAPQMAVDKEAISFYRESTRKIISVPALILCVTRLN